MLRRFAPALAILLCVILDTTIVPMVYTGPYLVPVTMPVVILIGMLTGRTNGVLYGMIGGLLIDISAGTLGTMTFYMMFVGFMIGFVLHTTTERPVLSRKQLRKRYFNRIIWVFSLYLIGEAVLFTIQYFHTAVIAPVYFLNILIRSAICTAAALILRPLAIHIFIGRNKTITSTRHNREVKSF